MNKSLADQINEMQQGMLPNIPDEVLGLLMDKTAALVASGIAGEALTVGEQAPGFSLPTIHGGALRLSDKLADGPVVISFYRGGWCPYCNLEVRALEAVYGEIRGLGAELLAIAPELPDNGAETAAKASLSFPLLSDAGNPVARSYGLVFTLAEELRPIYASFGFDIPASNGEESFELPMPATYIIDRNGKIAHAFVNADYTQRMEPSEILKILNTL